MGSPIILADMKKLLEETLDAKLDFKLGQMETDINSLKEQAMAQQLAIARLENSVLSSGPGKAGVEHDNAPSSQDGDRTKIKAGGAVPKFHKLEFPVYDGKEDPLPWLTRVEQFFTGQGTVDDGRTWLASYHLTGKAILWYRELVTERGSEPPWDDFTKALNKRFGPRIQRTQLGGIKNLRQLGSVDEYEDKFLTLVARCCDLTTMHKVELFVAGLRNPIRTDVGLQYPTTLEEAMEHARAYEQRTMPDEDGWDAEPALIGTSAIKPAPSKLLTKPSTPVLAPPLRPTAFADGAGGKPILTGRRPFKRLTPSEMDERRTKGQCFNCDEQFVPGHRCKRLFMCYIDGDDTYDDDDTSEMEVSLNALTGINSANTMQLRVMVHGVELLALVDSSSTHNFIAEEAAARVGIDIIQRPDMRVAVANGDRVTSNGVCRNLVLTVGLEEFWVDCYTLALGGIDIVLGVQWLRSLGPIYWDFTKLAMTFWHEDHHVTLLGEASTGARAASCDGQDLLAALLEDFAFLFAEPQGLPPSRPCDHRIHLLPGATPAVVRPYRYPTIQKDEIER
ncbi:uncharacterized protein [Lolium perenne]|uniref:uncharacterized protein n=1 Tax=Lolium perenne TaxID=4522 RepID=UPI003A9A16D3